RSTAATVMTLASLSPSTIQLTATTVKAATRPALARANRDRRFRVWARWVSSPRVNRVAGGFRRDSWASWSRRSGSTMTTLLRPCVAGADGGLVRSDVGAQLVVCGAQGA